MGIAVKLIPLGIGWVGILLVLLRGFSARRSLAASTACVGFTSGVAVAFWLVRLFPGDTPFTLVKLLLGAVLLAVWATAVTLLNRRCDHATAELRRREWSGSIFSCVGVASLSGVVAGIVSLFCFAASPQPFYLYGALAAGALVIAVSLLAVEPRLPDYIVVSPAGMTAALAGFLFFSSSSSPRLDLFAPLTMRVMKFAHDFVHQFFESMLIPDHMFFTSRLWDFVGLFFGNGIGFWGAVIIWFTPGVLIVVALNLEPLPLVASFRQGAKRRALVAAALRTRRLRLVVPAIALLACSGSLYESLFPKVEYWDPKPIVISATPSGEIIIPVKGDVELEDGKLHKYLFKQGGTEARFFIMLTPDGKLTAVLDACSICKPDGYGQNEGVVICYYCKTLIPLETVGKPGGCNPVPLPFSVKSDGVHIDAITLVNIWNDTAQSTSRVKEKGAR